MTTTRVIQLNYEAGVDIGWSEYAVVTIEEDIDAIAASGQVDPLSREIGKLDYETHFLKYVGNGVYDLDKIKSARSLRAAVQRAGYSLVQILFGGMDFLDG